MANIRSSLNNVLGANVPGAGNGTVDEQTLWQISRALNNLQMLVTAAQTTATTAQTAIQTTPGIGTDIQPVGAANSAGTSSSPPAEDHIHQGVFTISFSTPESGALSFVGSSVVQSTVTFKFTPDGVPSPHSLPYTYTTGDTFLVLTPTGAGQTFALPLANSVPSGFCIRIHSGAPLAGNFFTVVLAGSDTFNNNGATTPYQINPEGATAYFGARFVSDGSSRWETSGYN